MPCTLRATESPGSRELEDIREMPWRRQGLCLYSTDNGREWKRFRKGYSRELKSKHCVICIFLIRDNPWQVILSLYLLKRSENRYSKKKGFLVAHQ